MLDRLRQSLAFRLAIQYALIFAAVSGVLFAGLYWEIAQSLEAREHANVERMAEALGRVYQMGGPAALRAALDSNASPEVRSYFVRVFDPQNQTVFASVPPDWVETRVEQVPLPDWGITATRQTQTVRIPQDALRDYTVATSPLQDGSSMQVGRLTDSRAVLLAPLKRAFTGAAAGALILSVAVGTVLAWRATRPIRLVSDTAKRIVETGDLAARVPGESGSGELAQLVRQFNALLERNAAQVRVLRESLDNLAHDLRTPLTRLRGTAEMALSDTGDPGEARDVLAECIDEADRLLHVIEALMDVTAAEGGALRLNRARIDLRSLLERAADLYSEVAEDKAIAISLDAAGAVEADVDGVRLGQAINNLLDNALKYTPKGGRVVLGVRAEENAAVVTVVDNGPGVPAEEREAVFRRLYRSDSSRSERGLGLGLSLVRAIVESHGGSVAVDDAPGGGARFTVRLPRNQVGSPTNR